MEKQLEFDFTERLQTFVFHKDTVICSLNGRYIKSQVNFATGGFDLVVERDGYTRFFFLSRAFIKDSIGDAKYKPWLMRCEMIGDIRC
jgi:hypothetical protein